MTIDKTMIKKFCRLICIELCFLAVLSGFIPWLRTGLGYHSAIYMLLHDSSGSIFYFELAVVLFLPIVVTVLSLCFPKKAALKFLLFIYLLDLGLLVFQPGSFLSRMGYPAAAGVGMIIFSLCIAAAIAMVFYALGVDFKTCVCFCVTVPVCMIAFAIYGYITAVANKINIFAFMLLIWCFFSKLVEIMMAFFGSTGQNLDIFVKWNLVISVITVIVSALGFATI